MTSMIKAGLILWIAATIFWSASGALAQALGMLLWTSVIVIIFVEAGLHGFFPWQRHGDPRHRRGHPTVRKALYLSILAALVVNFGAPMTLVAVHQIGLLIA